MVRAILLIFLINVFGNVAAINNNNSTVSKFLNAKKWSELFPNRYNLQSKGEKAFDFYSFKAFEKAAQHFPLFLNEGDEQTQKRELAAFLANVSQETGGGWEKAPGGYYKWGLYYVEEKGCKNGCPSYSDILNKKYPPVKNKSYHGRGPLQLSWNYNYGQFSEMYFGNKDSLLNHPEIVSKNAEACFASAIWFWMSTQYPKPSCHDVICGRWVPNAKDSANGRLPGFGAVINVINGGLECGDNHSDNTKYRYGFYNYFCNYFHVTPGANADCSSQQRFGLK